MGRVLGLFIGDCLVSGLAVREDQHRLEIMNLATDPRFQRKGYMRQLLDHFLQSLGPQRKDVFLEVNQANVAARELYLALGFAIVGQRRNYYPRGETALVMRLESSP